MQERADKRSLLVGVYAESPRLTGWVQLQDAAKKALQEMFQGKQDMLAAYDAGGGGSGKVWPAVQSPLLPVT